MGWVLNGQLVRKGKVMWMRPMCRRTCQHADCRSQRQKHQTPSQSRVESSRILSELLLLRACIGTAPLHAACRARVSCCVLLQVCPSLCHVSKTKERLLHVTGALNPPRGDIRAHLQRAEEGAGLNWRVARSMNLTGSSQARQVGRPQGSSRRATRFHQPQRTHRPS